MFGVNTSVIQSGQFIFIGKLHLISVRRKKCTKNKKTYIHI